VKWISEGKLSITDVKTSGFLQRPNTAFSRPAAKSSGGRLMLGRYKAALVRIAPDGHSN
jgi:hypothetical protein